MESESGWGGGGGGGRSMSGVVRLLEKSRKLFSVRLLGTHHFCQQVKGEKDVWGLGRRGGGHGVSAIELRRYTVSILYNSFYYFKYRDQK